MSAEYLRETARMMRETAEAGRDVTGASDWHLALRGLTHAADYSVRSSGGTVCADASEEEAAHIAAWHPGVALAVADWLEVTARGTFIPGAPGSEAALAVARAWRADR